MTHFARGALALFASLSIASPLWAAPHIRAPEGSSLIVRTDAGDQGNQPQRRDHYGFRAQQQQMHTGGGGNSK